MKKCLKTKLFAAILQSCLAPQAKILDIWSANYTLERRSWPSQNLNVLFFHSLPQISAFRAKLRQTHFHEIDFFGASRQDFFFGIQVGSFGIQLRQPWGMEHGTVFQTPFCSLYRRNLISLGHFWLYKKFLVNLESLSKTMNKCQQAFNVSVTQRAVEFHDFSGFIFRQFSC